ncbi:MAG: hypothetical protein ACRDN0_25475 [Trebonia sp.]
MSASCMFFMPDSPGLAELGAEIPGPPSRDELREIVMELADDLTGDISGSLSGATPTGAAHIPGKHP